MDAEAGPQEKAWWVATPASSPSLPPPPPPPVEVDAQIIYELDAGQIPELHGDTAAQEVDGNDNHHDKSKEAEELYAQKLEQWRTWSMALEPEPSGPTLEAVYSRLPLLTVSPPEASSGEVSPLLRSSWCYSSQDASPISPPPNAHFPLGHRENTNT
jgi:hypothetical protein